MQPSGRVSPLRVIILFSTVLLLSTYIVAQPQSEPLSPEEEWNPSLPAQSKTLNYQVERVSSGKPPQRLSITLVDKEGNPRREIYPRTNFAINFSAPANEFYIFLYLWYNNTRGGEKSYTQCGWIINGSIIRDYTAGDTLRVKWLNASNLFADRCKPARFGNYVFKMWIYDNRTKNWNVSLASFRYLPAPNVTITLLRPITSISEDDTQTLSLTLKNMGEENYTYAITPLFIGLQADTNPTNGTMVPFKLKKSEQCPFNVTVTPRKPGKLIVNVTVLADSSKINSYTWSINVLVKKPNLHLGIEKHLQVNHTEYKKFQLIIENIGNRGAESISITVSDNNLARVEPSFINSIKQGDKAPADIIIYGNKPPGQYTLTINASYKDEKGRVYSNTTLLSITVDPCITINTTLLALNRTCDECTVRVNETSGKGSLRICLKYGSRADIVGDKKLTKVDIEYIFDHWSTGEREPTLKIDRAVESKNLVAYYKVRYHVNVTSERGSASGSGWYGYGEKANITVSPTAIGLLVKEVFDHWEVNGERYTENSSFTLKVDSPKTVVAKWRTDYSETLLVVMVLVAYYLAAQTIHRGTKTRTRERQRKAGETPSV